MHSGGSNEFSGVSGSFRGVLVEFIGSQASLAVHLKALNGVPNGFKRVLGSYTGSQVNFTGASRWFQRLFRGFWRHPRKFWRFFGFQRRYLELQESHGFRGVTGSFKGIFEGSEGFQLR